MRRTYLSSLAGFYLTQFIRTLPGVRVLYLQGVKPFACDICMAGWTALPLAVLPTFVLERIAGAGGALALLTWARRGEDAEGGDGDAEAPEAE